jgi:Cytochrome C oxidase, cbb3-type, subunit III
VAVALLGTPAVLGQSVGEWQGPRQLWREICSYCHNERVAPELRGASLSAQALISAVRKGPNAMPSFTPSVVSDTELEQLARWLVSQPKPPAQADRGGRTPRHSSRERPQ